MTKTARLGVDIGGTFTDVVPVLEFLEKKLTAWTYWLFAKLVVPQLNMREAEKDRWCWK